MARTLLSVAENALLLLKCESALVAPVHIRQRVVDDINAAMQQIATSGKDYFLRETESVSLVAGTHAYALSADVLNVFLPARLSDGSPLSELKTRGEFDQFGQLYLGQRAAAVTAGKPLAVFFRRTRIAGDNPVQIEAYFVPTPSGSYTAEIECSRLPETYAVEDLGDATLVPPIAAGFIESILMPIVRWNIRTAEWFTSKDLLPSMAEDYAAAMAQLGNADPQTDQAQGDVLERKKAAARAAARKAFQETQ